MTKETKFGRLQKNYLSNFALRSSLILKFAWRPLIALKSSIWLLNSKKPEKLRFNIFYQGYVGVQELETTD